MGSGGDAPSTLPLQHDPAERSDVVFDSISRAGMALAEAVAEQQEPSARGAGSDAECARVSAALRQQLDIWPR
ncbi:MAG: hypothetical protein KDK91_09360 [Gammaproteobacteria bacterium]|nr:hypothetical protein [Gammaproteobacteria bacterium]